MCHCVNIHVGRVVRTFFFRSVIEFYRKVKVSVASTIYNPLTILHLKLIAKLYELIDQTLCVIVCDTIPKVHQCWNLIFILLHLCSTGGKTL